MHASKRRSTSPGPAERRSTSTLTSTSATVRSLPLALPACPVACPRLMRCRRPFSPATTGACVPSTSLRSTRRTTPRTAVPCGWPRCACSRRPRGSPCVHPREPMTSPVGDWAVIGRRLHSDLADVTDDLAVLDRDGTWIVTVTFEGRPTCLRFARSEPVGSWWDSAPAWSPPSGWISSMSQETYEAAVTGVRERIAAGDVYQANICRVLSAPAPKPANLHALGAALARGNPAPYAAVVHAPDAGVMVASASPELFLHRDGDRIASGPIKGTGVTAGDLTDKDRAENVMIVDLVRNDLGRVAITGSVEVTSLLRVEQHPGLVHLVSTVTAAVPPDATWAELLTATFPPASVTGAPKSSALRIIDRLEPSPRGVYCGAIGEIDADRRCGTLAVAIRTYEWRGGRPHPRARARVTWGGEPPPARGGEGATRGDPVGGPVE